MGVTELFDKNTMSITREQILDEAKRIVTQDRETQYGKPEDSFARIAAFWSTYLAVEVKPHDVAAMMTLLKIARIAVQPTKADSWTDGAGYLACGGSIIAVDATADDADYRKALEEIIKVSPEDSYATQIAKKALVLI